MADDGIPGLRAHKKRQTRQAISTAANRLFADRGFDRVTISEVAAAAGVAKMTVTNYFPRKEDLVLGLHDAFVTGPARTVAQRSVGESALAALRGAYLMAVERHDPVIGFSDGPFARIVVGSPVLMARLREFHEQREDALAGVLMAETGAEPHDITPRAAAALLGGAHRVLYQEILRRSLGGERVEELAEAHAGSARRTFDLLEPSLGGYAVRRG